MARIRPKYHVIHPWFPASRSLDPGLNLDPEPALTEKVKSRSRQRVLRRPILQQQAHLPSLRSPSDCLRSATGSNCPCLAPSLPNILTRMPVTSASLLPQLRSRLRPGLLVRIALVLLVAYGIGLGLNRVSTALDRRSEPAGFARGAIQGALMPCTLPTLLMGHDVTIYTSNNNGVLYKLGYTVGVNLCGALFFGLFYRRLARLRHLRPPTPTKS
jgi:hypothetical protein